MNEETIAQWRDGWRTTGETITEIANGVETGALTIADATRKMVEVMSSHQEFTSGYPEAGVFYQIDNDLLLEGIPFGEDRQGWSSQELAQKDSKKKQIEDAYQAEAVHSLRLLRQAFSNL